MTYKEAIVILEIEKQRVQTDFYHDQRQQAFDIAIECIKRVKEERFTV